MFCVYWVYPSSSNLISLTMETNQNERFSARGSHLMAAAHYILYIPVIMHRSDASRRPGQAVIKRTMLSSEK